MARSRRVLLYVVLATFSSIIHFSEAARVNRGADAILDAESQAVRAADTTAPPVASTTPKTEVAKNGHVWKLVYSPVKYAYDKAYGYFFGNVKDVPREATPTLVKPCYSVGTYLLTDDVCSGVQGESDITSTEEFNKLVRHVHRRDPARSVMPDCTADDLKKMCSFRAQSAKQQAITGGATECSQLLNTWMDLLRTTNLLNTSSSGVCKDYKTFHRHGQRAARLMYRNQLRTFETYMENTEKFEGEMEDQAFWPGLAYNMQSCLKDDASEDAMLDKAYEHVCGEQPRPKTWTDRIVNTWECCKGWFYGPCKNDEPVSCSNSTDNAHEAPCCNKTA